MLEGSSESSLPAGSVRPGAAPRSSRAIGLAFFVSAVVVLSAGVVVVQYGDGGLVSKTDVEHFIRSWGAASAAAAILLMVVHAFVPFPAELVAIANGMLFGILGGTMLTWVGAMLGAALSFGLARRYGRPFAEAVVAAERWDRIQAWIESRGVLTLLGSRLLPVVSFNLINMAAGFAGVSWWTFLWTTGIGILPMTLGMVLLGAGVLQSSSWSIAGALVVIVILGLGVTVWRRRRRARLTDGR